MREKIKAVRTTIEIADKHRARLMAIAASRGEKGFSAIVAEAIDLYLKSAAFDEHRRRKALKLRGSLTNEQADELRVKTAAIRNFWR